MAAFRSLGGWKLVTPLPDPKRGHRDAGHARHDADVVNRLFADIPSAAITIYVRSSYTDILLQLLLCLPFLFYYTRIADVVKLLCLYRQDKLDSAQVLC